MPDDYNDEILPRLEKSVIYNTFENLCATDPEGASVKSLVIEGVKYCYQKLRPFFCICVNLLCTMQNTYFTSCIL
jgi:hypothetical protein